MTPMVLTLAMWMTALQGLPGLTYNMNSLSDCGILLKNLQSRRFQAKMGVECMTSYKALQVRHMIASKSK